MTYCKCTLTHRQAAQNSQAIKKWSRSVGPCVRKDFFCLSISPHAGGARPLTAWTLDAPFDSPSPRRKDKVPVGLNAANLLANDPRELAAGLRVDRRRKCRGRR